MTSICLDQLCNDYAYLDSSPALTSVVLSFLCYHFLSESESNFDGLLNNASREFQYTVERSALLTSHTFNHASSKGYIVHFPCSRLDVQYVNDCLKAFPNDNHIFFDYPKISLFHFYQFSFETWKHACLKQVERSIDEEYDRLLFVGQFFGCMVAANVASELMNTKPKFELLLYRGFSSLETLLQEKINMFRLSTMIKFSCSMGLGLLSAAMEGCSLFIQLNRLMAFFLGGSVLILGYLLSNLFKMTSNHVNNKTIAAPFVIVGNMLDGFFAQLGGMINTSINLIGSLAVGLLEILGFLTGAIIGALLGLICSVPQLFAYNPCDLRILPDPVEGLFKLNPRQLMASLACSLPVEKRKNRKIIAIHPVNDSFIPEQASLQKAFISSQKLCDGPEYLIMKGFIDNQFINEDANDLVDAITYCKGMSHT